MNSSPNSLCGRDVCCLTSVYSHFLLINTICISLAAAMCPATYNSFPLIDRFSNLEKMISRGTWGKEKIFHWQAILCPSLFFISLSETRMWWLELQQADIFQPQSDRKDGSYIIRNSTTEGWRKTERLMKS